MFTQHEVKILVITNRQTPGAFSSLSENDLFFTHLANLSNFTSVYENVSPEVVILAVPDPAELCKKIRNISKNVIILPLLERRDEGILADELLRLGADDFISPDSSVNLITKRIQTQLAYHNYRETVNKTNKYRRVIDSANDAMFIVDLMTGKMLDINNRAMKWLGYDHDTLMNLTFDDLLEDSDVQTRGAALQELSTNGRLIFEYTFITQAGQRIQAEVSSRLITYEDKRAILNFARDITQRKSLETERQRQKGLVESLLETAEALNSTLDVNEIARLIIDHVLQVIPAECGNIMLVTDGIAEIYSHAGYGEIALLPNFAEQQWIVSESEAMKTIQSTRQPLLLEDKQNEPNFNKMHITLSRSYLGAPIIIEGEVIGFLHLEHREPARFHHEHAAQLQAFANQTAIAIHNARLHQAIKNYANELEDRVQERTSELESLNNLLAQEIEERIRIEVALEDERNLLRTIIDHIPDEIYVKDKESRFILINQAVEQNFNMAHGELIGLTDLDIMDRDLAEFHLREEQQLFETGSPIVDHETMVARPGSTMAHIVYNKIPIYDSQGEITTFVGINHDTTRIRATADALEHERNLLRTLIDNIPDLIYIKDQNSRFILVNKTFKERHNLQDADIIGKTDHVFLPQDRAELYTIQEQELFKTGQPLLDCEIEGVDLNGSPYNHIYSKIPIRDRNGEFTSIVGINHDITVIRQTTNALERERNLLRAVIDNSPDDIYVKDTDGKFVLVNKALEERLRSYLSPGIDVIGSTDYDYLSSEQAHSRRELERNLISSSTSIINQEVRIHSLNGEERIQLATKIPVKDSTDTVTALVSINRDVTAVRQADIALNAERTLLRNLLDNIPDEVYVQDVEGEIILANRAMKRRLAASQADQNDRLHPKGHSKKHPAIIRPGSSPLTEEIQTIDPQIGSRWYLATQVGLFDDNHNPIGVVGINRDITDLRRAEERISHIINGAACLLWYAIVDIVGEDKLSWQTFVSDVDAAQRFLPLNATPYPDYMEALNRAVLREDRPIIDENASQAILRGASGYSQEFRTRRSDGEIRWLREETQIRQLTPGRFSVVGVATDITERKEIENTLQTANELLEQRVKDRTQELTQSNEVLMRQIAERNRAERSEREQRQLAEALSDAARALNETLELSEVLDRILTYVGRVVPPHDQASIALIEDGIYVHTIPGLPPGQDGISPSVIGERFFLESMPMLKRIVATKSPLIIENTIRSAHWIMLEGLEWVKSYIGVPILSDGQVIGCINLYSQYEDQFGEALPQRLTAFANQAGIAIQNARLFNAVMDHVSELSMRVQERTVELENERAQLATILNAMTEGVIYSDRNDHTRYINHSLAAMTGYAAEEWRDRRWIMLIGGDDEQTALLQKGHEVMLNHGIWSGEIQITQKNSQTFDAHLMRTLVKGPDGLPSGSVTVVRDISAEKRLEAQKTRFIATASHELRTPLTNLKTRLYLIQKQPHKLDEHLEVMNTVTNDMRKLVSDLFDISRFEHGIVTLDKQEVVVQNLLRDVIHIQSQEAQKKQIEMFEEFSEKPLMISADLPRIKQVFTNLVTNAINYTEEGGTITLSIQEYHQHVMIRIKDTGIGIPEKMLPYVFKPFFRVSDHSSGMGLGLNITREIIEAHNGTISVESILGEGTTFTLHLPKAPGAH